MDWGRADLVLGYLSTKNRTPLIVFRMRGLFRTILVSATLAVTPSLASDASTLAIVSSYLGTPPSRCASGTVSQPKLVGTEKTPDGPIKHYRAKNCAGELNVLVGIPKGAAKKTPVVLALPQTGTAGAREVFGLVGEPKLSYGRKFMSQGMVVVSPDVWLNGRGGDASQDWSTDRFYKHFPHWSALGRMLVDNRSSLGLVKALGRRPSCIAAVGHSLGGHNALFLAAFDKRINVAVSSGGFEPIATDTDAERWSRSSWFVYSPALRNIVTQPAPRKVPFDFSSLIGAIYPRAVMVVQGTQDPTWTHEDLIPEHLKSVEEAYRRTKIAGQFDLSMFKGGHEFPEPEQRDAVEFVRERCRNSVHR